MLYDYAAVRYVLGWGLCLAPSCTDYLNALLYREHGEKFFPEMIIFIIPSGGLVAQWITRLPTEQKIPGSSPGKIDIFFVIILFLIISGFYCLQ